jgi:long-chain acyl-CoA synthetase
MMSEGQLPKINQTDLTLAGMLREKAAKYGGKPALRIKGLGIWQETSWQDYYARTREFSLALSSLGIQKGDTLAVIGHNRPSSFYAILGTQVAGGIPLCIHHESTSAEVASIITGFNLRYIVAEDQEQVDKILEIPSASSTIRQIIYCNPKGLRG